MRWGPIAAVLLLASLGAGTWYWASQPSGVSEQAPRGKGKGKGRGRRQAPTDEAVTVTAQAVKPETVTIVREGIGNVQALLTVTVRPQVEGRLLSVEFTEGQDVRKGDVLARIDPVIYQSQYDQALAKKAQDEANLANARIDLERYERLAQSNAGTKQQADQQRATVAQLEAQVRSDVAAIANAKAYLDYTTIVAPIDGRAGLRQIDPGNIARSSDAGGLVTIAQVTPIAAVFTLPQRDLPVVAAAMARGPVAVEAMQADGQTVSARGQLEVIDNQIDTTTGTLKLKAVFPNADRKLWPGQFVSVRVAVDTLKDAKVVPAVALRRGNDGLYVYAIDDQGAARVKPVTVVWQDELRAVVGNELSLGTKVVTAGFSRLADGRAVTVEQPPPDAAPTAKTDGEPAQDAKQKRRRERANRPPEGETKPAVAAPRS